MKIGKTLGISLLGLEGHVVEVQAHVSEGLPLITIVGLPDTTMNESKQRFRSAILTTGLDFPPKVVVNLSPANLPKQGSGLDLPMAMAVLGSTKAVKVELTQNVVFLGELGLDGRIYPVNGVLPSLLAARRLGQTKIVVASANLEEASLIDGVEVVGFGHLSEVVRAFGGKAQEVDYETLRQARLAKVSRSDCGDMADVIGQESAKIALEIAAAGGHHVFMTGSPGTGKTMLASRIPSILPPLDRDQSIEVTSIYSLAGLFDGAGLITTPPFQAPHHTATAPAIIGGGSKVPKPGSVSRAHRGVLFMDEAPEFSPRVLQTLRQPLESGSVTIDRAAGQATYPAKFMLVMAANPCPCGLANANKDRCTCTSLAKRKYLSRLSGPLLDRIDITCQVNNLSRSDLEGIKNPKAKVHAQTSEQIRERVIRARVSIKKLLAGTPWTMSSEIPGSHLRRLINDSESLAPGVTPKVLDQLNQALESQLITLRGADRALRVALTIAHLDGRRLPNRSDVARALSFRIGVL